MNCPSCKEALRNDYECTACGWKAKSLQTQNKKLFDPDRHRCHWRNGTKRCELLGNISYDTHGDTGQKWYCGWHYVCLDDARFAQDKEQFKKWYEARKTGPIERTVNGERKFFHHNNSRDIETTFKMVLGR